MAEDHVLRKQKTFTKLQTHKCQYSAGKKKGKVYVLMHYLINFQKRTITWLHKAVRFWIHNTVYLFLEFGLVGPHKLIELVSISKEEERWSSFYIPLCTKFLHLHRKKRSAKTCMRYNRTTMLAKETHHEFNLVYFQYYSLRCSKGIHIRLLD